MDGEVEPSRKARRLLACLGLMVSYCASMHRQLLPSLSCLLAMCIAAFCADATVSSFQSKPAQLTGIVPIETKDLASFMEFGLRVVKGDAKTMTLWRRYDISDQRTKLNRDHAMHGWLGFSEEGFLGVYAEWVPKDSKDPRSVYRAVSRLQTDERNLIAAVVDRACTETGMTRITRVELCICRYLASTTDPRGSVETYMWHVDFDEDNQPGSWSLYCVPASVNGDRGMRLGKSRIYISREGDPFTSDGRRKELNKWSRTLSSSGGSISSKRLK